MLAAVAQGWAQGRTISGKVVDQKTGQPLSGVTISSGGKNTISDPSGNFKLITADKSISVSFVGYEKAEIKLGSSNTVNVSLNPSSQELDEVVVVGYGTAKKKKDVAGSVVTVNAERVQDRPTANILDALQGQVPGLQVYTNSGEPSTTPSVRLNGVGSLGASSTPLYIMDGVPIDPGTVLSLNPEDFESITVLRDASATSIYGARAANGVIIYTTKKGKVGKSQISLNTQYAVSGLVKPTLDMFNGFMNTKQLTDFWVATG